MANDKVTYKCRPPKPWRPLIFNATTRYPPVCPQVC